MNAIVKGWCPTAMHPMESGDGLLVRVRVRGATLHPAQAVELAELAQRFGNGAIDLTRRGNLQLRGVRPTTWRPLVDRVVAAGLLNPDAAGEGVSILEPPVADLDPESLIDARALARDLEARLPAYPVLANLPAKFCFSIDDGGALPLGPVGADISLVARRTPQGVRVALVLAEPHGTARAVPFHRASDAALRLARAFLHFREQRVPSARRMAHLLREVDSAAIFAEAGLADLPRWSAERDSAPARFGLVPLGVMQLVGIGAAFGAWSAQDFAFVAERASECPGATLRLTPWRAILVAGLEPGPARAALSAFAERGLITSDADPRLAIQACPGEPACTSATVDTRSLARTIGERLPRATRPIHISGCSKGCASSRSGLTLVGRDGQFDLVEGRPADAPSLSSLRRDQAVDAVLDRLAS